MKREIAILAAATVPMGAWAQSINLDMDDPGSPPIGGGGVPSASFGGAANLPGFWNNVYVANIGTQQLRGLDGNLTSARIVGPQGGSGGGSNLPQNSGNFSALLNDARTINGPLNFSFDGLTNGSYKLYTYVVSIAVPSAFVVTRVFSPQSLQGNQMSTGPMPIPGNRFVRGITHTEHDVNVTSGQFSVTIENLSGGSGDFNGLQLVSVPEPTTLVGLSSLLLLRRLRSTGRHRPERARRMRA